MNKIKNNILDFLVEFLTFLVWFMLSRRFLAILNVISSGALNQQDFINITTFGILMILWYFVTSYEKTNKKCSKSKIEQTEDKQDE